MNAIIALCHFCDSHGPRTLFCTQAFKYADLQQSNFNINSLYNKNEELLCKNTKSDLLTTSDAQQQNHQSHSYHHEQILGAAPPKSFSPDLSSLNRRQANIAKQQQQHALNNNGSSSPSSNYPSALDSVNSTCKACRAFDKNFHHYISYESDYITSESSSGNNDDTASPIVLSSNNNICYVSQSTPSDSEVFALVRKACVRTLHCEVFEDPIYFDDDKNGSVIGYEFQIKDSEGRGYQRSYSLLIIMKDRIYLQNLWSFLSQQMAIIASNIKLEAQRKFDKDMKETNLSNQIPNQTNYNPSNHQHTNTFGSRQSIGNKTKPNRTIRGLIELTDDQMIFAKLHMWFTWILRMSSCKIKEEFIHGPLSEDIQVKLEREKLNQFLKDESNNDDSFKMRKNFNKSNSNNMIAEFSNENSNISLNNSIADLDKSLDLEKKLDSIIICDKLPGSSSSDVYNFSEDDYNEFILSNFQVENLRQLVQLIGKGNFHQIAYNTIVGNQVILRGKYECLTGSIIRVLEELIPLGCCQSVYYSNEYVPSFKCKLLGLSDKVTASNGSSNTDSSSCSNLFGDLNDFIFIDLQIIPKKTSINNEQSEKIQSNNSLSASVSSSSSKSFLPFLPMIVSNNNTNKNNINNKCSTNNSESHIKKDSINNEECSSLLNLNNNKTSLSHLSYFNFSSWLNLVKEKNFININIHSNIPQINQVPLVLNKIETYLMNDKLDDKSVACLIKLAKEEWLNKTKVFYKFIRTPSYKDAIDTEPVLKMLKLDKNDELALRFWQAGLSDECKTQIRTVLL